MEEGDGVVERLAMAAEDLDAAAGFQSGAKEDVLKKGLVDMIGARAGEEQRAGGHFCKNMPVHLLIGSKTGGDIIPLLDKGGWIEDDEIVSKRGCFKKFEEIGLDEIVVCQSVQSKVFFHRRFTAPADFDAID